MTGCYLPVSRKSHRKVLTSFKTFDLPWDIHTHPSDCNVLRLQIFALGEFFEWGCRLFVEAGFRSVVVSKLP